MKAVLIFIGLVLVAVMTLYTPLFNISQIQVFGADYYSVDEIRLASGILPGENGFQKISLSPEAILGMRLTDAEEAIKVLPYVKEARVRLIFPNSVKITITERQPAAYLTYLGNYLTVDSEGVVLEVDQSPPKEDLKEVRGVEFTKYTTGKPLETDDIDYIRIAANITTAVKKSDSESEFLMWPMVNWIDVVDANTTLVSLDNRVIMRFDPSDKLQYVIDFAKEIFFTKLTTSERGRLEFVPGQDPSFIPD